MNHKSEDIRYLIELGQLFSNIEDQTIEKTKTNSGAKKATALRQEAVTGRASQLSELVSFARGKAKTYGRPILTTNKVFIDCLISYAKIQGLSLAQQLLLKEYSVGTIAHLNLNLAREIFGITNSSPETKYFLGYVRFPEKLYIDLFSLSFASKKVVEPSGSTGVCEYGIYSFKDYKNSESEIKPELRRTIQSGTFNYKGHNLTALTRAEDKAELLETYFSIRIAQFPQKAEKGFISTGLLTTILKEKSGHIGAGLVILEPKDNIDEINKFITEVYEKRVAELKEKKELDLRLADFYDDEPIKPVIQHALYGYSFGSTEDVTKQTNLINNVVQLDYEQNVSRIAATINNRVFSGYYRFDYLDVEFETVENGVLYINKSGHSYICIPSRHGLNTFYFGYFRIKDETIATLQFDYHKWQRGHRLSMVISLRNHADYLYGIYGGIEHSASHPISGRIRFTKLKSGTFSEAMNACGPSEKANFKTVQAGTIDHELWMFLTGKLPESKHMPVESFDFYQKLLKQNRLNLIDGELFDSKF